jgi:uncharacterized protein (TIGR00730 family)
VKSVAVYCGSAPGMRPAYADAARALGTELAQRGIELVYGGASVGLMGVVADAALAARGKVIGVIPRALVEKELAHGALTELIVVDTMHERKAAMSARADAFVAMPGGFGTLDETFEALTWSQLRIHVKPVGLLDVDGYYTPLRAWVDQAVREGFVRAEHRSFLVAEPTAPALLDALASWLT